MTAATRTFTVADDELSRLVRIFKLGSALDGSIQPARKPIEEVLEKLLTWCCDQLTGVGWLDPTACLVFRDGEWTGEAIDPLKLHLREQETGVEYVPSATAIRHDLESRGLAFEDTWYCAAMVDNLLAALAGSDDQRPYAMIAVGWWLRDWEWRRNHRKNAILGRKNRESNRRKGKQPKRRKWAEELAELITSWDEIPDSHDPLVIETLEADLEIYRDGNNVVCVVNDKETKLARLSFEKRYLGPSLKARGQ